MKIQLSKAAVVAEEACLYIVPGSAERDRQSAAEGETKHEQAMTQTSSEGRCGTAVSLPQPQRTVRAECCAVPLSRTLGTAHAPHVLLYYTRPAATALSPQARFLADLGGLVCGLHSSNAALKEQSTSLSINSATHVWAGACIRRVVTLPRLPTAIIVATTSLPETALFLLPA